MDATGVGDIFTGYFLAEIAGGGVEEVLRRASATVGISVYEHGVASGNSDREEVSSILLMQERRNC